MSAQFIEHWRRVAEFDYPALQAELAKTQRRLAREQARKNSYKSDLAASEAARERAETNLAHIEEGKG